MTAYEVYLVNGETGLQVQQGGATYSIQNVNGVLYVPQDFFQAIIPNNNISLSGSNILVLASQTGSDVWANFWGNMNAYQAPVVEPPVADTPVVDTPDVTYPDVDDSTNDTTTPSTPSVDQDTVDEIVGASPMRLHAISSLLLCSTLACHMSGAALHQPASTAAVLCSMFSLRTASACHVPPTIRSLLCSRFPWLRCSLVTSYSGRRKPIPRCIYIGDGQYIHAPAPGQSVCIQSYDAYPFDTAGRVLA